LSREEEFFAALQPLPPLLAAVRAQGQATKVPILQDEAGRFLALLTALAQPRRILEIGSGIGYSTLWMLQGQPQAQITCLDTNLSRLQQAARFLDQAGALSQVTLLHQAGQDYLNSQPQPFDLIFLDCAKKDYAELAAECYKALVLGGLLVADNLLLGGLMLVEDPQTLTRNRSSWQGIQGFLDQALHHPGLESRLFALGDGLLVGRKLK